MEKTVKSCGECDFQKTLSLAHGTFTCDHPDAKILIRGRYIDDYAIHPNCPEGGEFVITTKKLDNDKSK